MRNAFRNDQERALELSSSGGCIFHVGSMDARKLDVSELVDGHLGHDDRCSCSRPRVGADSGQHSPAASVVCGHAPDCDIDVFVSLDIVFFSISAI